MEEQSSINRIFLVVGFIIVLFLFKEYAALLYLPGRPDVLSEYSDYAS